jgi:hypothetical protein
LCRMLPMASPSGSQLRTSTLSRPLPANLLATSEKPIPVLQLPVCYTHGAHGGLKGGST